MTTFVMLAIGTVSPADATTPSMPATAIEALPAAGQVRVAGAAPGPDPPARAATVGATACSGQSSVVAEYAADQEHDDRDRHENARAPAASGAAGGQELGADRDVGGGHAVERLRGRRRPRDRVFIHPGDRDASIARVAGAVERSVVVTGGDEATAPTTPELEAAAVGAGVRDVEAAAAAPRAPASTSVSVGPLASAASTRPRASDETVADADVVRPRRVGGVGGGAVSSGVIRPKYPLRIGTIINPSTRESGEPG